MRKANVKGLVNAKGFKFELKIKIDSFENKSNKHYDSNKDYRVDNKNIKGFNFDIACEADSAEINIDAFAKDIKEQVEKAIEAAK